MGGQNTKVKSIDLIINHPIFQHARLIVEQQQRKIQISMGCSQKQFTNWVELQQRKIYPQYLMLPLSWSYSSQAMCGDTGLAKITFDDYPYLLSEEIYNRRGYKKGFDQCDLWYLLYALISAKKDVLPFSKKLGDVRPQNIFINTRGEVKVAYTSSWPGASTNSVKVFEGQSTFLAPEQIRNIDALNSAEVDLENAQLFSIGLTLLSAATLTDLSYLYGSKGRNFDYKAASNKIQEWISNNFYSQILRATIANLCQFQSSTRMNAQQMYEWIENYKGKIKAKSNFVIEEAPIKLHNHVKSIRIALGLLGTQMIQSRKGNFQNQQNHIIQSEVKYHQKVQLPSPNRQASSDVRAIYRETNGISP